MAIVTVKKGDTLWEICLTAGLDPKAYKDIAKWNSIPDPNFIYVGEKIAVAKTEQEVKQLLSTSSSSTKKTTTLRADVNRFGLQSDTESTVFATWTWLGTNTDYYQVKWYYYTDDGIWFVGQSGQETEKQSVYNAPSNATKVKFIVKPVAKKTTKNGVESSPWTASWSTEKSYSFINNPPTTPPVPTVSVNKYTLTAEVNNLDVGNAHHIEFWLRIDQKLLSKKGKAAIADGRAVYKFPIEAGKVYTVRCRSLRGDLYSDWSDYSDVYSTIPATPAGITTIRASSETSVYLEWSAATGATSYDVEYASKKEYLDGSDQTTTKTGITTTQYDISGLETGKEYFFRLRAVNDKGESGWSDIVSVVVGTKPSAPTTWSSTTTVITGEPLTLYWVHNSEDGSSQRYAELEIYIGDSKETHTVANSTDEDEKDKTSSYSINTSAFVEGTKIYWRVRTAGITKTYGDWSVQRTVDVYAPPTLSLRITDVKGELLETLTTFPFYVYALTGPDTQLPIGYHVTITANEMYETIDQIGNEKIVSKGDPVYSKYFDIMDALLVEFSANNIDLENNISYTVTCTASMNSGLTVEESDEFTVAWTDEVYEPNAEIAIDEDSYTAYIRPYCEDENGNLIEGVLLSVYRREYDGRFVELATGIDNLSGMFVTDPHPALDYARYRVVATTEATGAVSYYDIPGYPVGGKSVILQWDEEWSTFDVSNEDPLAEPAWSGSLLKLPYNIDVSDSYDPDVTLVEYIGKEHPTSYYGTQVGETATWSVLIAKEDKETLYALRRLSKWMGNVYVREPSGSGYWAHITIKTSLKHLDVTAPINMSVTRVEGGI